MSICPLVRKQLKVKGKTQHTGRGSYWMRIDCNNWEEMKKRLDEGVKVWESKGMLEKNENEVKGDLIIRKVRFKKEFCKGGYYRELFLTNKDVENGSMTVGMVFSSQN